MKFSLCNIALTAFIAMSITGCGKNDKKSGNKAAVTQTPEDTGLRAIERDGPEDNREEQPALPTCSQVCGGGECVLSTTGSAQGICALNGQLYEDIPCGAGICEVERSSLDCHDYCKEQALSAMADDVLFPFMSSPGQKESNMEGGYTGYCQTQTSTGEKLTFPQCSGSVGFCTANQCNLEAAKTRLAEEGQMCAFSWEGESFTQKVPGAAATIVVQYAGLATGWVISSMGCEYQAQNGASAGYKVVGPNQVSECFANIDQGVSQFPSMGEFTSVFGSEIQKLDITLPAQGKLSNVLRGSQFLVSCAQVMLKLNSQYSFNFITAFNGGVVGRGITSQQQSIHGFRAVPGQYTVSNFVSKVVTVEDYMLMHKEMGTKLSAMCFDGFNAVQQFCTEKTTCRADGLLQKKNTVILEKDLKEGGNYRITGLECADLKQKALNFDNDITAWKKINLFLAKYLGNVPADQRRKLLTRIQTSFHPSLAEGMMSVAQMAAQREAYTSEVRAELESSIGLSRYIAGSAHEHTKLSSCSRVYQDWVAGEDMQYYVGQRLNAEMKTGRLDAFRTHMKEKSEQCKIDAAMRAYSELLGHNLYQSLHPAFAKALEKGQTLAANNDAGLMADLLCSVAVKAMDEPTTLVSKATSTCAYTSPNVDGAENTLYISNIADSANPLLSSVVAQAKMKFIQFKKEPSPQEFADMVDFLMKKKKEQKSRNPRDIVHPPVAAEEASAEPQGDAYDIMAEVAEGKPFVQAIIGVTCGARHNGRTPAWSRTSAVGSQSFSLEQIYDTCASSDVLEAWGYDNGSEQMTLKDRFKRLVFGEAGMLQVRGSSEEGTGHFEGDFCDNIGYQMFSNFNELNANGGSPAADLKKTEWSNFLGTAIPKVYAENQGPTSLSQVLDAPMAADVLCTIAWTCDLLRHG